jgi:signal transduction histidine kinase/CheY-like chemotaxis protein
MHLERRARRRWDAADYAALGAADRSAMLGDRMESSSRGGLRRVLWGASLGTGSVTVFLGLLVIFGWYTGNRTLVQILPNFVPMQYNTALGFVFCGVALLLLALQREQGAAVSGWAAFVTGALTLVQYIGQVDLGIDELFMKHDITVATSHPGRMAPNTAVCFVLIGLGTALNPRSWSAARISQLKVVLGSLALGLSVVALAGYVTRLETAYGWGNLTRMAVHTSVGFVLVSTGLLCFVWRRDLQEEFWLPEWMAVPTAVGVITATLSFWQAMVAESARIERQYADLSSLSEFGAVILIVGGLLALAMAAAVRLAQTSNRRAIEIADTNITLQRHRDNLEEQVALRTRELDAARQQAVEANRAKSKFLANMSHELRTPMNAIIGYAEMLIEDAEDDGDEEVVGDLRKIQQAGRHLLALINDVLDLSKIEAGRMDLYLETFEIRPMVDEVVATIDAMVQSGGNRLSVDLDPTLHEMRADLTKVRQGLFNLLSNAAKFTESGGITLSVRRETADGRDWVNLSVTDTGIGIPADKVEQIFEEFSQADESTTRNFGGTGLGLAITRRFCRMMGGDVTAESTLGQGSTFSIRIPLRVESPARVEQTAEPAPTVAAEDGRDTVLVIDDDPNALDLLSRTLGARGLRVVTATGGEEAVRLARTLQPKAITLDVIMPGMDGWAVLGALKSNAETRHIPVIMVTMTDDREMGLALGATEFLTKPIQRDQLLELVSRHRAPGVDASVLVVDDDPVAREIVRRALEAEGLSVVEAEDGRAALERLAQAPPSLILLDLMMPVMDGFEFIVELRRVDAWRQIPVVVVTAKDVTDEDRGRLNGDVQGLVQKDGMEREAFLERIRELLP